MVTTKPKLHLYIVDHTKFLIYLLALLFFQNCSSNRSFDSQHQSDNIDSLYHNIDDNLDTPNEILYPYNNSEYKWGLLNVNGETVVQPIYDTIISSDRSNMHLIKLNSKWGLINSVGKVIAETKYDSTKIFSIPNVAAIQVDNNWGFVDFEGEILTETKYQLYSQRIYSDDTLNAIPVYLNDKLGLINNQGKIIIEPKYDKLRNQRYNKYFIKLNDKWGCINANAEFIAKPIYDEIHIDRYCDNKIFIRLNDKWGVLDNLGNLIHDISISSSYFDSAINYSDNYNIKKVNGKFGIVDQNDQFIFKPQYDKIESFSSMYTVTKNGKMGLVDIVDKVELIPPIFDYVAYYQRIGNLVPVLDDCTYSFYDIATKKLKVDFQFDKIDYDNSILLENKWYFIDESGKLTPKSKANLNANGLYKFSKYDKFYNKHGVKDVADHIILPAIFDSLEVLTEEAKIFKAKVNNRVGYVNGQGELVGLTLQEAHKESRMNGISTFNERLKYVVTNEKNTRKVHKLIAAYAYLGEFDKAFEELNTISDIPYKLCKLKYDYYPLLKDKRWDIFLNKNAKAVQKNAKEKFDIALYKDKINICMKENAFNWALNVERNDSIYNVYLDKKIELQKEVDIVYINYLSKHKQNAPTSNIEKKILARLNNEDVERLLLDTSPDNCFNYKETRTLETVFDELVLKIVKLDPTVCFYPPATDEEIREFEKQIGYKLPAEIVELYKLANGRKDIGHTIGIFGGWRMLSLKESLASYKKKNARPTHRIGRDIKHNKSIIIKYDLDPFFYSFNFSGCVMGHLKSKARIPLTDFEGEFTLLDLKPSSKGNIGQILFEDRHIGNSILDYLGYVEQNFEKEYEYYLVKE